ncbi:unnamed protein product, partial [Effrenium voratum]
MRGRPHVEAWARGAADRDRARREKAPERDQARPLVILAGDAETLFSATVKVQVSKVPQTQTQTGRLQRSLSTFGVLKVLR